MPIPTCHPATSSKPEKGLRATLDDQERVLGPDHPDTLARRHNLACVHKSAGDQEQAIQAFEAVLADRERVLSPDHPDTLYSRSHLAGAYETLGDLSRATQLYERTVAEWYGYLAPTIPSPSETADT